MNSPEHPEDMSTISRAPGWSPPPRRRRGRLIAGIAIGVVVLAALAVGAVLLLRPGGQMTVSGTVTIPAHSESVGGPCSGYDGIGTGTEVEITDSGTKTIALGSLGTGHMTANGCEFPWTAKGVPTGKGFYGASVGGRGMVKLSEVEMHQLVVLSVV